MIRIRDISLPPDGDMARLVQAAARQLRISPNEIKQLDLKRRSVDARKKNDVRIIYTVDVAVKGREDKILKMAHCARASLAQDPVYHVPQPRSIPAQRPVIVGFGPAGMFAALVLSMAGLRPLVLERGQDAKARHAAVLEFWKTGTLDPECNVQFGEGGAGTFSDGKLNTGVKNERIGWILEQFAGAGASADILYDAKPHIGTDELGTVVQKLRETIIHYGGEVRFGVKVTGLVTEDGRVTGVRAAQGGEEAVIPASCVLLAIGHSARDTFEALHAQGVPMEPKPFSMGVRIEHPQRLVNESQYGPFADAPGLGAADYKLNVRLPDGSSAYTFCMCPGGYVVAAASEEGGVVTNGMSDHARDGENANAALLVTLNPADFPDRSPLGGMYWQRQLEQTAFRAGGSNYRAPAQLVGDFLAKRPSQTLGAVQPTYRPGVTLCELHTVLPERITASKEFCDCRFRWRFTPEDAHGVSLGKTLPAVPSDVQTVYPKEPFTARNAANIPCTQVLGTYMVKGVYMAADHTDINPNNTKLSAYTAYVGNTVNECGEYVCRRMETFRRTCGEPTGPMMRSTFRTLHEADKQRMAAEFLQKMHWDQRLPQIDFDDPG